MQIQEYLVKTNGREGQQCSVSTGHPCIIGGGVYYGIFEETLVIDGSYSMSLTLLKDDDGIMGHINLPVERIRSIKWE